MDRVPASGVGKPRLMEAGYLIAIVAVVFVMSLGKGDDHCDDEGDW